MCIDSIRMILIIDNYDTGTGHDLDAYLDYLAAYTTFHCVQRLKLIVKEARKRLGFYFALSLENTTQRGMANGIGILADAPLIDGDAINPIGSQIDGEFQDRFSFGFNR